MKSNEKKLMVMIGGGGTVRIGQAGIPAADAQQWDTDGMWHPDHRAELLPMTEDAFAGYIARHGGKPVYPTLAAYPTPRG
jgi:hypothetical protein